MARLTGEIAGVTGGAAGIGEATVRRFVAEGAKVVFCRPRRRSGQADGGHTAM
jgi:3alpha(or 20beta)-hydroxysteroid dehydrogenase